MNRMQEVSRVGLFGVIGNIFLMLIKLISGIIFNSQAMIADAINSIMDIFASLMTLMGGKISSKPRDHDHQFGHGKAEFIFSLFVSISMLVCAVYIFSDAIRGLLYGHEVYFSFLLLVVCLITILVKFCLFLWVRKVYKRTNSLLVLANMVDHRNDIVVTIFTFLSVVLAYFKINWFDSSVSIGIAIWIGYSGILLFVNSYQVLMDKAMDEALAKKIQDFILKQKGIEGISKFETTPSGYQYILILSILVDGDMSTFKSHKIADTLEKLLLEKFSEIMMVTVHVNPIRVKNKKKN